MKKKYLHIDIMCEGRYVKTIHFAYCPLFRLTYDDVLDFIESKVPTIAKNPKYQFVFPRL